MHADEPGHCLPRAGFRGFPGQGFFIRQRRPQTQSPLAIGEWALLNVCSDPGQSPSQILAVSAAATMSAATESTASCSTAESTTGSAAESATSCRCCPTGSACKTACGESTSRESAPGKATTETAIESEAAPESKAATPTPPGAYAEEDAAGEPAGAVIAIGRTGIRVVRVIAPFAGRGTIFHWSGNHCGANSNPDSHLSTCCRCRERQSQEHCKQNQAKSLHISSSCCPALLNLGTWGRTPSSALAGPRAFAASGFCPLEQQMPRLVAVLLQKEFSGWDRGQVD